MKSNRLPLSHPLKSLATLLTPEEGHNVADFQHYPTHAHLQLFDNPDGEREVHALVLFVLPFRDAE